MPLFDYTCGTCGFEEEELVDDAAVVLPCACKGSRRARTVARLHVVGPVFSGMEDFEKATLGVQQMKAGVRFRGAKDIEKWEHERGLERASAAEIARMHEFNHDESNTMKRVEREGGTQAVQDYALRTEVQERTGWSDSQYTRWKEHTDAAERYAAANPSAVA